MRFRVAVIFGLSAALLAVLAAACIPGLITDPGTAEAGSSSVVEFLHCGDGLLTLGQYDGGYADLDAGEQCDPSNEDGGGDAGVIGCTRDCRVECEDGGVVDPLTRHCYFPQGSATSLNEGDESAEQRCEAKSAHVVTIADERERAFVLANFGGTLRVSFYTAFWVGLSLDLTRLALVTVDVDQLREPGWAPTCPGCYAPSNVADGSIPRLLGDAGGSCVLEVDLKGVGGWSQIPCSQLPAPGIPVLCEREPIGDLWQPCNGGICSRLSENAARKRYLFSPTPATADEAEAACGDLGGSVVVFETRQERETLLQSLVSHFETLKAIDPAATAPQEVWIGYSANEAGAFSWNADGGLDASPWGESQPSAAAGTSARAYAVLVNALFQPLDYDVQLAHDDTDVPRPYICQY